VPVPEVREWEQAYISFVHEKKPEIIKQLEETRDLSAELRSAIESAIGEFKRTYVSRTVSKA
jgi:F0F1-type ATP synthase alpha subunit